MINVKTEALRTAREMVKATLRKGGYKISSFKPKEITDFAKEVLKNNPSITIKAEKTVAARLS